MVISSILGAVGITSRTVAPQELRDTIEAAFPEAGLGEGADNMRNSAIAAVETVNGRDADGTSLLDIQRGVFNLLQACAYRVFRIAYACNYHTHERDHNYPYLLSNYVKFTRVVITAYKALEVFDAAHHALCDELPALLEAEEAKLREQIQSWTDADEETYTMHEAELDKAKETTQNEAVVVVEETDKLKGKGYDTNQAPVAKGKGKGKGKGKKNRKWQKKRSKHPDVGRKQAAFLEGFDEVVHQNDSAYLERKLHVLLDAPEGGADGWESNETRRGCVMPTRFWYEQFMPKLLAICSIGADGYDEEELQSEAELQAWYDEEVKSHRLEHGGNDIIEGWADCTIETKTSLKRAWRLTRHYMMGPQKQRERGDESGADHRETGDISRYVAFLDVYLKRSYVEEAGMRLTFPYFVGPSTWTWHHAVAERAAEWQETDPDKAAAVVDVFKQYFALFVTMYPCPYCRHHLNEFVYVGVERDLYPVEYLFVGWKPTADNLDGKLEPGDKLHYVTDGFKLRLFVWKLHNAVNSSIERGEEWYHQEESITSSRYWPNLYATLYRGQNRSGLVAANRLMKLAEIVDVAAELSELRDDIMEIDAELVDDMMETISPLIEKLDEKIVSSGFLQETYRFVPGLIDKLPDPEWSKKFGSIARNAHFTLA